MNAWKEIGETSFFVFNARKQAGHDLETCLGLKSFRDESQIVNGVSYPSLAEVAVAFGIKESVLESRVTRMSLEEAVTYNPSNGRYTLKRFKEAPVLAESFGYLYFIEITFPSGALHKVGITQRTVESRFAATPHFRTITVVTGPLCELFLIEQSIIKKFRANLFRGEDEFEGRTETFLLTRQEEKAILFEIEDKSASLKIRSR